MPRLRPNRRGWLIIALVLAAIASAVVVVVNWGDGKPVAVTNNELGVRVQAQEDVLGGGELKIAKANTSDMNLPGFAKPLGDVAEISVDGGQLDGQAAITFEVPDGVDIEAMSIFTYDEELKKPILVGGTVDTQSRTISVRTDHFSPWWLSHWELEEVYGENWAEYIQNDTLTALFNRMVQVPPQEDCPHPALAVEVETDTFKQSRVCATYNNDGELVVSLNNTTGAPLAITYGPGLKYRSVDPPDVTVFNRLAQFVRDEVGDETVVISGGRRVTFVVDPEKVRDNKVRLSARLNVGHAVLDFSGAMLGRVLPQITDDAVLREKLRQADQVAQYTECILSGAQDLGQTKFNTPQEMHRAFINTYSRCERNNYNMLREFVNDPSGEVVKRIKGYLGNAAYNQLPTHASKLLKRMFGILPDVGDVVTQPLFTVFAAATDDGRPYEMRLKITEPPLGRLDEALPDPGEANYQEDPALAQVREMNEQYGTTLTVDMLPRVGDPCVNEAAINEPWNSTAWLDPAFAGGGYRLQGAQGKDVYADVHISYVKPEHRQHVLDYMHSWTGATECNDTIENYEYKGKALESVHADGETVAWYSWTGLPNSDDIGEDVAMVAYDERRGYLLVVRAMPGVRGEWYFDPVPQADLVRVLELAYSHASDKANHMLGANFNRVA